MPGPFDEETVEFVTRDGRRLPMTRGVAEKMANEGQGSIDDNFGSSFGAPPPAAPQPEVTPDEALEVAPFMKFGEEPSLPLSPSPTEPLVPQPQQAAPEPAVDVQIGEPEVTKPAPAATPSGGLETFTPGSTALPAQPSSPLDPLLDAQRKTAELRAAAQRLEAEGNMTAATILSQEADRQFTSTQDRQAELEQDRLDTEKEAEEQRKKIDDLTKEIEATDIGDSRSLGQRILGGLAIGLFQMGSTIAGAPGTPNTAMQLIQSSIRRDIANQKQKLSSKKGTLREARGELGRLLEHTKDITAAEKELEAARYGQVMMKLESFKQQATGELQKKQAGVLMSELETQQEALKLEAEKAKQAALAKQRAARAAGRRRERESQRKFTLEAMKLKLQEAKVSADRGDKMQKRVFNVGKEFIKSGAGEVKELLETSRAQLRDGGVNPNNFFGAAGAKIPVIKRWVAQDTQKAQQTQRAVKLIFRKALTGTAGPEKEMQEIGEMLGADWNSSPELWVNAMNLLDTLNKRKSAEVRGLDPPAFDQFSRGIEDTQKGQSSGFRAEQ